MNEGLKITDDIAGVMCGNDDLAGQAVKYYLKTDLQEK